MTLRHTPLGDALPALAAGKDDEARRALSHKKDDSMRGRVRSLLQANAYDAMSAFAATSYRQWRGEKLWVMMPATIVGRFLSTLKD
jgi:hypothetical protein